MKKLPLGIQSFRKIIGGGYAYVDKTEHVYNLINTDSYYFLSRPRRFGKSLLLDTIGEAFSGDRELFKGLFIYGSDYGFPKHPVLRLDMSNITNKTPDILEAELSLELKKRAADEGFDIGYDLPSTVFKTLIERLYKKHGCGVVVLIDEYDKPILDHLDEIELAEANRKVLRGFYSILKSMDPFLRLAFITGVTKFTKASIFSELNNLYDITLADEFSCICGVAIEDLDKYFGEHIESIESIVSAESAESIESIESIESQGTGESRESLGSRESRGNIHDRILAWYDGYSWDGVSRVINPFSLLSFLRRKKFSSFWYSSGFPKFLIDLIKKRPQGYVDLRNITIGEWELDAFDIENIEAGALLFQAGYLTVKKILDDFETPAYILGIPNFEVREAFNLHLLSEFTESGFQSTGNAYRAIKDSLWAGDLQGMLDNLRSLFASIPYELHIGREAYYHSIFYAVLNLLGFDVAAEVSVSGGRIDATLELGDRAYVMEFKYMECPKDAAPEAKHSLFQQALDDGMAQLKGKGYSKKYDGSAKTVHLAAFAFLGRDDIEMRSETATP